MSERVFGFSENKHTTRPNEREISIGIYLVRPNAGCEAEFVIKFFTIDIGPRRRRREAVFEVYSDSGPCFDEEPFQKLWQDHLEGILPRNLEDFTAYLVERGFEEIIH